MTGEFWYKKDHESFDKQVKQLFSKSARGHFQGIGGSMAIVTSVSLLLFSTDLSTMVIEAHKCELADHPQRFVVFLAVSKHMGDG